jgi:hypothetical protein
MWMTNVAGYADTGSGTRLATRPWAALAAAATVVGASLSLAAPESVAHELHLAHGSQAPSGGAIAAADAGGGSASAVVNAALAGLHDGKPSLDLGIKTAPGVPISSVTVVLPPGLFFASDAAKLAHGVRATGSATAHSQVRRGQLTITLKGNSSNVSLTMGGSALTEGKRLQESVEQLTVFNQAHQTSPRDLPLKMTVTVLSGTLVTITVPVTIDFK